MNCIQLPRVCCLLEVGQSCSLYATSPSLDCSIASPHGSSSGAIWQRAAQAAPVPPPCFTPPRPTSYPRTAARHLPQAGITLAAATSSHDRSAAQRLSKRSPERELLHKERPREATAQQRTHAATWPARASRAPAPTAKHRSFVGTDRQGPVVAGIASTESLLCVRHG
jgi:hypothetical protein